MMRSAVILFYFGSVVMLFGCSCDGDDGLLNRDAATVDGLISDGFSTDSTVRDAARAQDSWVPPDGFGPEVCDGGRQ